MPTNRPDTYKHNNDTEPFVLPFDYQVGPTVVAATDLVNIPPKKINVGGLVYVSNEDKFYQLIDKAQIESLSLGWREFKAGTKTAQSVSELKTIKGEEKDHINLLGYYEKGDGGGGLFYWDSTSTETDNGGTIIEVTGITTGRWKRITESKTPRVEWFGLDSVDSKTNFEKAFEVFDTISLSSVAAFNIDYTIPFGKKLIIKEGGFLMGNAKLLAVGKFIAGAYKICDPTFNLRIRPSSNLGVVHPEWFGAVPMDNPRNNSFNSTTINSTDAFKKVVDCITNPSYGEEVYGVICKMSGFYAINDEINIYRRSIRFIGYSQQFNGSGFRWIGTGDPSKSILKINGSSYSEITNLTFIADKTETDLERLSSAIEVERTVGSWTQRGLVFKNISVGDVSGVFQVQGTGFSFEHGIYNTATEDGGVSGNNDFHIIENYRSWGNKVGIRVGQDQSVDWEINSYIFGYGNIMYVSDLGGSFKGSTWYAAQTTYEGIIKCNATISQELRFQIDNFSSEHLKAGYFLNSSSKVKMKVSTGFIAFIGTDKLGAVRDKVSLIKGNCFNYDGEFDFERIRFSIANASKLVIKQSNNNFSSRSVFFTQCSRAHDIYFDYSDANSSSQDTTIVHFKGNKQIDNKYYKSNKTFLANVKNEKTDPVTKLLLIKDLLDGSENLMFNKINFGLKGFGLVTEMNVLTKIATTNNSFINRIQNALPANSFIESVNVWFTRSNYLFTGLHRVSVGTINNEEAFGFIQAPNAYVLNTLPVCSLVQKNQGDIVLKGWFERDDRSFNQTGTDLTSNLDFFTADMVGGEFRWKDGDLAGKSYTITSFINATTVTVDSAGNALGKGYAQARLNAKDLAYTITFKEYGKGLSELGNDMLNSQPVNAITNQDVVPDDYIQTDSEGLEFEGKINPEGVVYARKGAIYQNKGSGDLLYVKSTPNFIATGWKKILIEGDSASPRKEKRISATTQYTAEIGDEKKYLIFENPINFIVNDNVFSVNMTLKGTCEGGNVNISSGSGFSLSHLAGKSQTILNYGEFKIRFKTSSSGSLFGDLQNI